MKLALVAVVSLLALAWVVPAASAIPPVCIVKEVTALRTSVEVQATCGPQVTVTHCPPVGHGPCWITSTEHLLA